MELGTGGETRRVNAVKVGETPPSETRAIPSQVPT